MDFVSNFLPRQCGVKLRAVNHTADHGCVVGYCSNTKPLSSPFVDFAFEDLGNVELLSIRVHGTSCLVAPHATSSCWTI